MSNRSSLLALSAAAAALVGFGGCGSSTLSKSQLIAKGDAVCKRINDGIKGAGPTNSAAAVAAVAPKIQVLEQQGVNDLRKLKPPGSVSGDWSNFVAKMQALTDQVPKLGAAASGKDQSVTARVVSEATQAATNAALSATKLGLKECARQG